MPPKPQKPKKEKKVSPPPKEKEKEKEKDKDASSSAASARRRNRVPISCTICRRRKVKCDKKRPVCTACERTGVAHLCHYIDPPWAQPLSNAELNAGGVTNTESTEHSEVIDKLKDKIKHLEAQLSHANSASSPGTSASDDSFDESQPKINGKTSESLNLGKKFDMLHIKSTTTVHLGATSWLAIMKGDPYLRVLWAHIFKLRKQAEEMKFRKGMNPPSIPIAQIPKPPTAELNSSTLEKQADIANHDPSSTIPTCPVSGKDLSQGKCPVIHSSGKCPVSHRSSASPSPSILPEPKNINKSAAPEVEKCPVSGKSSLSGTCPVAHSLEESEDQLPTEDDDNSEIKNEVTSNDIPEENGKRKASVASSRSKKVKISQDIEEKQETEPEQDPRRFDRDERVCPLMIGDNSFLGADSSEMPAGHPPIDIEKPQENVSKNPDGLKRGKKRTQSNDNVKAGTSGEKKVKPEDFKKNPVAMMQKFLPTKKVFWMLLDRFFEFLYIYMPFVDEESFKEEIKTIFGNRDDKEQEITIRIKSGTDFALVGTVCIILRLTWNTLPMNNLNKILKKSSTSVKTYTENQEVLKILQKPENEIKIELVDCVKHCFSNLKLMRRSSLRIVQCALYMRLYFLYSPEDGDGADGSDSQIFLGMIIQMAISIGLHRDPKNFENFTNQRQRHLWRKIWYELVSLDIQQSMNLGCPRCLQNFQEFSDTKLPGETEDGLDLKVFENDIKELAVIKNIHTKFNIDRLLSKTMKILLNVNEPATRYQVDQLIEELQKSINGFGTTTDEYALSQLGKILVNRTKAESLVSSASRGLEFRLHVTVNMLIYLLNYILFVHFEPKGGVDAQAAHLAKNYAQKALDCALEGYRNCTLFFDCGLEYFGPGVDLILAPLMLLVGHRSIQFMVSLILRSRCGPFMKPSSLNKEADTKTINPRSFSGGPLTPQNAVDNGEIRHEHSIFNVDVNSGEILATILLQHMDKFHSLADLLGGKYQYSWRMSKAVGFFVTLLKKPINTVKPTFVKTESPYHDGGSGKVSAILNSGPMVYATDEDNISRNNSILKMENGGLIIPESQSPMNQARFSVETPHYQRFQLQQQQQQQQQQHQQHQQQLQHQQQQLQQQQMQQQSMPQLQQQSVTQMQMQQNQNQQVQFPVNSPYSEMNQQENGFIYSNDTQSQFSAPTPQQGGFSLAFNVQNTEIDNNPINGYVEINEQFPEIIQATEGFAFGADSNRSFGELFGVGPTNDSNPMNGPQGMGNMNVFSESSLGGADMFSGGANFGSGSFGGSGGNSGGPNEVNMMMSGSWFN